MPFAQFDRSQLNLLPLDRRVHDVNLSEVLKNVDDRIPEFDHPALPVLAEAVVRARRNHDATVLIMYGAHVIRTGNAMFMIELMKRGLVTHFATNGAGSIHDFELAMIGHTCESVARYVSEGQFGLWKETGLINDAVRAGAKEGIGWGEAVGKYIWENRFPNREKSVLAMGYHLHVPCTVHIGIGNDIIHEHPNCDGAAMGFCSYTDFLIYAQSVTKLENGVFLNFGSAVAGPEVYLKALAMARNVARQRGEKIVHFDTAVFDLMPIEESDDYAVTPPKSDPRYYFRPWKTILARTVADGGRSFYVRGEHQKTLPNLARQILTLDDMRAK
ncbi:hypothetical protein [Caproiciproducens sp. CPB-2]|uniref:hypothetical protein n=1 Tax=unclassified Caproiciproducens TaxID=2643836 RepID=UPI0023DBE242|nr:hypothetical protein [Caproiciproducens sp. CPB-2]MDF1494384.1 hypothetical protein [Caproiciproducens sp. CPB-2]